MLQEAFSAFWSYIKKEGLELSSQIFDMDEAPPLSNIIEALASPGFFGKRGWVIIKGAQRLTKKEFERISSEMRHLSSGGEVTVSGEVTVEADPRILFLWKGKPEDYIRKYLEKVIFLSVDLPEREIPRWIEYKARELGLEPSREAIEYILEITQGEPGIIFSELQKIAMAGVKRPSIEDLKELLSGHSEYDIRDLYRALREGNRLKALLIFRSLREDMIMVVGGLNKFYSKTPVYKKVLPILQEMDLMARVSREYLEPLFLRLLKTATEPDLVAR